jgi:hypothetical protein
MEEILCHLFFMLITPVAVAMFFRSLAAERDRLGIYLEDKKTLDVRIEKWRAMKRELSKWKEQELRKAEERRILRENTVANAVKQIVSKE